MTNELKQKLSGQKMDSFDEYLKCFLQSIWHRTYSNVEIDDTLPVLVLLESGIIKEARYLKNENLFRCSDDSVAYRNDVVKFMYIEDLVF